MDVDVKRNDTLNMVTKLEIYLSYTKIRLKVTAFKHLVGDTTQHQWLSKQVPSTPVMQRGDASNTVRINSRFDYNGLLFKVVGVGGNDQVLATCLWGEQVGMQLTLPLDLVVGLVKRKRNT